MSQIFDRTLRALESSLNARLVRHNVTSANIANAETPGYVAKKVDFEENLIRALAVDGLAEEEKSGAAIERVKAEIYDNPDAAVSNDKNTVDLEKEMAALAENTIMYKAATELMRKKLGQLKYAISEGGR